MNPLLKFVSSVCVQTAVYWANPRPDGYGGYIYDYPVEIACRWDENIQLIRSSNGEEVVSKAQLLITQDVDEGGVVYLGELSDLDLTGVVWNSEDGITWNSINDVLWVSLGVQPGHAAGAWKILSVTKTPLFQSTDEFVRMAYL